MSPAEVDGFPSKLQWMQVPEDLRKNWLDLVAVVAVVFMFVISYIKDVHVRTYILNNRSATPAHKLPVNVAAQDCYTCASRTGQLVTQRL